MKISEVIEWALSNVGKDYRCVNANTEWCQIFATYKLTDSVNKYSCTRAVADWKRLGKFDKTPHVGDLIYFENLDNIAGDIDHVGIVIDVSGTKITTVEGNTAGNNWRNSKVGKYKYDLVHDARIIAGFAHPTYDSALSAKFEYYSTDLVNTQLEQVSLLQRMLNHTTNSALICDGYYGSLTRTAVINYQFSRGLEVDGIAGQETITKLIKEVFFG